MKIQACIIEKNRKKIFKGRSSILRHLCQKHIEDIENEEMWKNFTVYPIFGDVYNKKCTLCKK